ncbi:hypothetical protein F4679DRAFT_979 [Xylaria curta]|nr:hypothetical protein F4679DRAFT_979 [Xylaria curta]
MCAHSFSDPPSFTFPTLLSVQQNPFAIADPRPSQVQLFPLLSHLFDPTTPTTTQHCRLLLSQANHQPSNPHTIYLLTYLHPRTHVLHQRCRIKKTNQKKIEKSSLIIPSPLTSSQEHQFHCWWCFIAGFLIPHNAQSSTRAARPQATRQSAPNHQHPTNNCTSTQDLSSSTTSLLQLHRHHRHLISQPTKYPAATNGVDN